jgi:hypothetical protein
MEEQVEVQETQEEVQPEIQEQVETTEESTPSQETQEVVEQPTEAHEKFQKRINQLTRQKYEKDATIETLSKLLQQNTQKQPQEIKQSEQPVQKPKEEDFDTHEQYLDALVDFKADGIRKQVEKDFVQRQQKQKETNLDREILTAYDQMVKKGFDEFGEDFAEIVNVPINQKNKEMVKDLLADPNCPKILNHLRNNPDIAQEVYSMSPYRAGKFFGDLSSKLVRKKPASVSKAPDPIKPVGDNYEIDKPIKEMSQAEYEAKRMSGKIR